VIRVVLYAKLHSKMAFNEILVLARQDLSKAPLTRLECLHVRLCIDLEWAHLVIVGLQALVDDVSYFFVVAEVVIVNLGQYLQKRAGLLLEFIAFQPHTMFILSLVSSLRRSKIYSFSSRAKIGRTIA